MIMLKDNITNDNKMNKSITRMLKKGSYLAGAVQYEMNLRLNIK